MSAIVTFGWDCVGVCTSSVGDETVTAMLGVAVTAMLGVAVTGMLGVAITLVGFFHPD